MERPLPASPRSPCMNTTPLLIEDAMPGHRLHLHDRTGNAPVFFPDFLDIKTEALHHPPLIMLIQ